MRRATHSENFHCQKGKVCQEIRGQEAGHGRTHAFRLRTSGIEEQAEVEEKKLREVTLNEQAGKKKTGSQKERPHGLN